jgi:phosphinothricin acetyltransferase
MPEIRPATDADAADMARIYNQAVTGSTATFDTRMQTTEQRLAWLHEHGDGPRHPVLVAVEDDSVVGWGSLSAWSPRAAYDATVEVSTYIDEDARGHGVGPALSGALLEMGEAAGVHAFIARITATNEPSLKMTKRLGFQEVGRLYEVGVKFGETLDIVMLEKLAGRTGVPRVPRGPDDPIR